MQEFIPRKVSYVVGTEVRSVGHEMLLEIPSNVVLLGEAGGGKTRLTQWLGNAEA